MLYLYFFIALYYVSYFHAASSMPLVSIFYTCLCTLMYLYDDT
nr:MAG TPA: hypothetical protein [Caudoviricetes sp.]